MRQRKSPQSPAFTNGTDAFTVFDDELSNQFFIRCVFHAADGDGTLKPTLAQAFDAVAKPFKMKWSMHPVAAPAKVLIMVSKLEHCLADLLFRWRMGELKMDIVRIVSNHRDREALAHQHDILFHCLPITPDTKAERQAALPRLFRRSGAALLVLARYIQILSAETSRARAGLASALSRHSCQPKLP